MFSADTCRKHLLAKHMLQNISRKTTIQADYKSSLLFLSVTITQNETHGLWFTGRVDPAGHLLTCGSMSGLTYRDNKNLDYNQLLLQHGMWLIA